MRYELGQVCSRLSSGKGIPASQVFDTGEYPVYGGNGLRGYTDHANFEGECAIVGRQGAFCGNVRFFSGKAYMTEHAVVICANEHNNTRYLSYLLSTMNLGRLSGQSAQPGLSVKTLAKQEIELPALEQQNRIVSILASLEDKIELNQRINDNLQQQINLIYNETFANEKDFVELGSVVETTSGGTPSRKQPELYENPSISWVKSKELDGGFIHNTEEKINELALSKSSAKMLPIHSVLVAMYGATVGEYGIIALPMACNQAICAIIPNADYPYPYLYELIQHSRETLRNMAVGSAQQNISQILIKQLPIHMNTHKVRKFSEKNKAFFQLLESITLENFYLMLLRDTLLPKLMFGEIKVSDIRP